MVRRSLRSENQHFEPPGCALSSLSFRGPVHGTAAYLASVELLTDLPSWSFFWDACEGLQKKAGYGYEEALQKKSRLWL